MNILDKVRQPENRKLELKRSLPPRAKWLKSIIAFANGAGGELILGVDDKDAISYCRTKDYRFSYNR